MATQASMVIEDDGGNDAVVIASNATIWTRTAGTIQTANTIFEENENVIVTIATASSTTGAGILEAVFVTEPELT